MKKIVSTLLSVSMSVIFVAVPVRSQDGSAQDGDSLKARIELLESTEVKSKSLTAQLIYKRSLLRLYNHYSAALEQEIEDLKNIQAVVSDADSKMRREVAASIQKLTSERDITAEKIETLTGELRAAVSSGDSSGYSTARGQSAPAGQELYEQASYARAERPGDDQPKATLPPAAPARAQGQFLPPALVGEALRPAVEPQRPVSGSNTPANSQSGAVVEVDWASRSAGCPPRVSQSTRVAFRVTNVNDVLFDFSTGATLNYALSARGSRRSQVAPSAALDIFQTGTSATCPISLELLNRFRDRAIGNPLVSRSATLPGGETIPLADSLRAARGITVPSTPTAQDAVGVLALSDALSQPGCAALRDHPVAKWVGLVQGPHTVELSAIIEPDKNYDFTITENWVGTPTRNGKLQWDCGEDDVFTLSLGPVVSTLPSRTYEQQRAPVPAGSTTVKNILTVGNTTNVNVLGAALINYHFRKWRFLPGEVGFGLSAGPVYTLGSTPDVSALGLFVGPSIHLTRSLFLTPGLHIGEFADFPAGFTPGAEIPDQFGQLNPVKRRTARFAFGITYRTNSFKKTSGDEGTGGNSAANGGSSQGSGNSNSNQSTTGNTGSGGNN